MDTILKSNRTLYSVTDPSGKTIEIKGNLLVQGVNMSIIEGYIDQGYEEVIACIPSTHLVVASKIVDNVVDDTVSVYPNGDNEKTNLQMLVEKETGKRLQNIEDELFEKLKSKHVDPLMEKAAAILTWEDIMISKNGKHVYFNNVPSHLGDGPINTHQLDITSDRIKQLSHATNSYDQSEKLRAIAQIMVIADYYNGDWKADWNDGEQAKYQVSLLNNLNAGISKTGMSIGAISTFYYDGTPVFKSWDLAWRAYENNKEIFETALMP